MKTDELEYQLSVHARKGGKITRRRQIKRVRNFLVFCRSKGVKGPDQIGKSHVWQWYEENVWSESAQRDHYYAISLLWKLLGRGKPPYPRQLDKSDADANPNGSTM